MWHCRWPVFVVAVLVTMPITARAQPLVLAHCANWQNSCQFQGASVMPLLHKPNDPCPGYTARTPYAIAAINQLLTDANIIALVSWWARHGEPQAFAGDDFFNMYLSVQSPVRIGILYEMTARLYAGTDGMYDFNDPANRERVLDDMEYLTETYFRKYPDRFFTIDGRVPVYFWATPAVRGPFAAVLDEVRLRFPIYVITSPFSLNGVPSSGGEVMDMIRSSDAVTAYGTYDRDETIATGGVMTDEYIAKISTAWLAWSRTLHLKVNAPNTKLILPFSFAFNNMLAHPDSINPPLTTTPTQACREMTSLRAVLNSTNGTNIIGVNVVSLTEVYEGTAVMPSEQYGPTLYNFIKSITTVPLGAPLTCPTGWHDEK